MNTVPLLALCIVVTACAPLHPHNTLGEDVGEVALRVVGCPLTLCISELALHDHRRRQADAEAHAWAQQRQRQHYQQWYRTLSPQEQAQEDYNNMELAERERDRQALREAAALNALGQINQGRGLLGPGYTPPPVRQYDTTVPTYRPSAQRNPRVDCTSNVIGNQVYTNCH